MLRLLQINFRTLSHKTRQGWGTLSASNHVRVNLYPLGWTGNVSFPWSDPVPNDTRTQNVGHKLVFFAVPNKQCWTGTSATIQFRELRLLVGCDLDFVLQHASGPEHAHHVGLLGLPQADGEIRRVLPEISVGAVDFVFLANAVGENFDLGPDGALVRVQSLEREPQPVVFVATFIPE